MRDYEDRKDAHMQREAEIGDEMAELDQAMVDRGLAEPGDTADALQQALNAGRADRWWPLAPLTFDEQQTAAVELVDSHPGVEHIWLNAMSCVRPTDAFAAEVGRMVIAKVMAHKHEDVFKRRNIVLRINAS